MIWLDRVAGFVRHATIGWAITLVMFGVAGLESQAAVGAAALLSMAAVAFIYGVIDVRAPRRRRRRLRVRARV